MKPAPFAYERPETKQETLGLLAARGSEAKLLAGGQSLVPLMAFRLARPSALIDINRVEGLDAVRLDADELVVGSMARHRAVEQLPRLSERCALVADAVGHIGHVAIRNRGTVGGSIAHADPAAEWPLIAVVLGARFTVESAEASRAVSAEDMFVGYLQTSLAPEEMLVSMSFPLPPVEAGSGFVEVARRHGDFAMGGSGVVLHIVDDTIVDARVGLMSAGLTPVRARLAEQALLGRPPTDDVLEEAARSVDGDIHPLDDVHGPADYKRNLAYVTAKRAMQLARKRGTEAAA